MILISPKKARKFFDAKMEFTTGPVELNEMIKNHENINIVDVRKPDDYKEGHIPGAVSLSKERWSTHASLSKDKVNIVYCYSQVCHLAAAAAKEFAGHGFAVMELEGGFEEWQHYNMPIET